MVDKVKPQIPGMLPGNPTTDVLGNATPAAMAAAPQTGVDALAGPAGEELPLAPVSGGATLGQILSAKNSPHLQKFSDSISSALKADPSAVSRPGGVSKLLIGAGLEAVGASLGDVAAVGTVPSGGGALTGAARALAARTQRIQQQKKTEFEMQQEAEKNKALIAESNVRMIHEQKLVHQMDESQIAESIDVGTRAAQKLKTGASPAPVIAEGLTGEELKKYLVNNKIDPTKETAYPTGRKVVGQNPDGTPLYETTYTALGIPPEVTLKTADSNDKKLIDDMNRYAPPQGGGKWGTGDEQKFSGAQYNWIMQQVADGKAQTLARDKTMVEQGMEQEKVNELKDFNMGPDWTNALSNAPGHDPVAARNAILASPTLAAKYKNLDADISAHYPGFPKMLEDYQKKIDAGMEQIVNDKKDLAKAHGEDAATLAEYFQGKMDDPTTPAPLRVQYARMKDTANKQVTASLKYSEDKKAREVDAENKANEGDLSGVTDMVLNYQYDPDKLFSRFKDLKSKREFLDNIHKIDPTWSDSTYKARYKTAQDFAPEGKGGIAKQSLNAFAGHVGDANNLIQTLNNTRSPLLNTPLNKIKESVLGEPQFIAYRTGVSAAADEYINFLLNQKAKHASDDDLAAKLTSTNTSPAAAQAMFRQMANTITIRARAMNKAYRDQMGTDIPNFLDSDTAQVLQNFGIDPKTITNPGQSGLVKSPTGEAQNNGQPTWGSQFGAVPRGQ